MGSKKRKLTALEIEIAVAAHLNPRANLIVPNVSWGLGLHECDLLVITPAGFGWEVEIKVSKADLVRDKEKLHGHVNHKIKDLWFAIPDYLEPHIEHIPERAGIITVDQDRRCRRLRSPSSRKGAYRFNDQERYKAARLGALRIWGLKRKIRNSQQREAR